MPNSHGSSRKTVFIVAIVFAVLVAIGVYVGIRKSSSPEAWAALAGWVTAAVAAVAGVVALGQLGEARHVRLAQEKSRREQAQPYVVAYIEASVGGSWVFDLVVRNYGATAAFDVRLDITPTPRRSIDAKKTPEQLASEIPWLPEALSILVPGQEWKTLWDTHDRANTDLPDRHDVTIRFLDSDQQEHKIETVLDWRIVKERHVVTVYGTHDAAKALREINKTLADWREPGSKGPTVWVRDPKERDRDVKLRAAERAAKRAVDNPPGG